MNNGMERFARQMMLPQIGEDGQRRIMDASVLVVGLGGLGCPVSLYLAGAGVGCMGLADIDTVSESNLHRQLLYTKADLGKPKIEAAACRLKEVSPTTRFALHSTGLNNENALEIISAYDLVIDCCDNHATRYLIDDVCAELGKPWIYGAISGFDGLVSCFTSDSTVRYSDLYPERDELSASGAASGGVIGPTPGVIGSIEAAEALKILTGMKPALAGKLLTMNLLTMEFQNIEL